MAQLVSQVHRSARKYKTIMKGAAEKSGQLDRVELFMYRTGALESEVVKPFLISLLDPDQPTLPEDQRDKALNAVESWMVRRMLVRATTKAYNQLIAELITEMRKSERARAGDVVETYLRNQPGDSRYWPDDDEVRRELETMQVYRRLRRGRLRMVLEAIEDHLRGWVDGKSGLGGERVARGKYAIEHVMPRQWEKHWPLEGGLAEELERDQLIHTLGNLTLLTGPLNSKVSNGPWQGENGKSSGLAKHDVLLLNRELLKLAKTEPQKGEWTEIKLRSRTATLIECIISIWPTPAGHHSTHAGGPPRRRRHVEVADLIAAGMLESGQVLHPRGQNPRKLVATVLPDGSLDVEGEIFQTPSGAAKAIAGTQRNGWWFFLVEQGPPKKSLRQVWRDYVDQLKVDVADEEEDEEEDDS